MPRHFLTLADLSPAEFAGIIERGIALKTMRRRGEPSNTLAGKVLGMIFEKSSTRTRVSFESGIFQLGGTAIFLSPRDTQLGRGEPVEDTARVLSRMVDIIAMRTFGHETLERFAEYASVPVINALSDRYHPCQVLADVQTFVEHRGNIAGATVAWIGDGNNMCNSFINAARLLDFHLRAACPNGYEPDPDLVKLAGNRVIVTSDPKSAVENADLVVTDVWASMGQESEQGARLAAFDGYQVNRELMALAKKDALVMHCLPAHRGEEISAEVIDGPNSVVWDEAENRLHVQKALMEFLLDG
ncbi:MAG: ornithine carbamoyltransferase [Gammaproteobacteria bacterium]|nr:ornithine carbamoyltransferase [Gammaproteobacteria bacterium]